MLRHRRPSKCLFLLGLALVVGTCDKASDDEPKPSDDDGDDKGDDDDNNGEVDNVAACERWVDSVSCGDVDVSTLIDCDLYESTVCDISDYFDCLSEHTACTDGVLDTQGWANCIDEAECDEGADDDDADNDDDDDDDNNDDDDSDDDDGGDGDDDGGDGDDDDDGGDDDDDDDPGSNNECNPGIGECPEGQKCQPYVKEEGACCTDATQCVELKGTKQRGEDCIRERYQDDCDVDLFCFAGNSAKEGPGVCLQMCNGADSMSCNEKGMPDAVCIPHNMASLPVCHELCHPLRPNCEDGEACFYSGFQEYGYLCTAPDPEPGKGSDGDTCASIQACNEGLQCWTIQGTLADCPTADGANSGCCTPNCDLSGDGSECIAPETCIPTFPPDQLPHPMYVDAGICGLADE